MFPVIFLAWKFANGTKWMRSEDVDLVEGLDEIEAYERTLLEKKKQKAEATERFKGLQQRLFCRGGNREGGSNVGKSASEKPFS